MKNLKQNTNLTIIIVLYKETEDIIFKTLETIKSFKIIIIDNDGNESLKQSICQKYRIEKYVLNKKNRGFSSGYNQGVLLSETNFTMILNPDCVIEKESVILLSEKLLEYNDALIVSPRSFNEEKKLTFSSGLLPENDTRKIINEIHGDTCVESTLGSCMLFETKEIKEKKLFFDEIFFLYFSDDDLCRRVKDFRRSIIQVHNAICTHSHGKIKVKNIFLKTYLREFHFTFDMFYYYFKINNHHNIINSFEKKRFNYIVKFIIKLVTFQFVESIKIISKLLAYSKFKNFIKKRGG